MMGFPRSLAACVALLCLATSPAATAAEPSYTIRWAQIHLPSSAADRAAFEFAERVERETDGDVVVQVYSRKEYEEVAGRRRNAMQITGDVVKGELLEMTQSYTHVLARYHQPLRVLGMPYLFRDYDHAEQIFNGPLGAGFTDDLETSSKLKGLGITYSGGMGVISANVEARDPSALSEMRILISRGRYARMAFLLGGSYVVVGPDGLVPLAREGLVDAAETTVSCFDVYEDYKVNTVVNETHHFLLTSMVVINKAFFGTLPPEYQEIVTRVAQQIVVDERQWSIESTHESRNKLEGMGITFHDLTQAEKDVYKAKLEPLYGMMLTPQERALVRKVRAVGTDGTGDGLASLAPEEDSVVLNAPTASDAQAADQAAPQSSGGCAATGGTRSGLAAMLLLALGLVTRRRA